ncbi:hypothetical protein [Micromonospora qiuiae]|uniref:hypothetical protein n=1 Tax=Micromonospora qiuiae TaxID=502268 RepID=UPI0019520FD7|nr:hypothetical protein [Micromonospora qiuiae]
MGDLFADRSCSDPHAGDLGYAGHRLGHRGHPVDQFLLHRREGDLAQPESFQQLPFRPVDVAGETEVVLVGDAAGNGGAQVGGLVAVLGDAGDNQVYPVAFAHPAGFACLPEPATEQRQFEFEKLYPVRVAVIGSCDEGLMDAPDGPDDVEHHCLGRALCGEVEGQQEIAPDGVGLVGEAGGIRSCLILQSTRQDRRNVDLLARGRHGLQWAT